MMTSPRFFTRRSFAFMAVMVCPVVSSISMSHSAISAAACASFVQSSSVRLPLRRALLSTIASLESIRVTSWSDDISSEKMQTAFFVDFATLVPMFSANEVLPIPGRAPISTRSLSPMPTSTRSRPENPVGVPLSALLSLEMSSRFA